MHNAHTENFTVPHSQEAEQSILGGLLVDNDAIDRIGELPEAAFFTESHRLIYRAIRKQSSLGKTWDVITVAEMLDSAKRLDSAGGFAYIGELSHNVHTTSNIGRHADAVREHAMRRQIMGVANTLNELVAAKGDIANAMDKTQAALLAITEGVRTDEPRSIREVVGEHFNLLEKRLQNDRKGITTGLCDLDYLLNGGFQRGQSVVLAGRPGHCKSAVSLHCALTAAQEGFSVLYLSMEMVSSELADRALASVGRIYLGNLLTGKLKEQEWEGVTAASGKFHDMPLHILDRSGLSFFQVATIARRHKRKNGLDLMVIDYLQLMAGEGEKRHSQIEEITRGIKSLAKELNCAIVLLSQLSRKTENSRRPKLSDLRDSSSVEQDADVVLFTHYEENDNPSTEWKGYVDLHVAKNRQGSLGRVGTTYIGHQVRFENFSGALPDWDSKANKKQEGYK
jgi:replicative DNA helicase